TSAVITGVFISGTSVMTLTPPIPTFPVILGPNASTSFSVQYLPSAGSSVTGQVVITFTENSQPANFLFSLVGTVTGTATAPGLTASYSLADGNVYTLATGAVISFPMVDINGTTTATITISNQGTGTGGVTGISVAGTGFRLSGLPLLPATIPTGQSLRFGIVFAPTQAGTFDGSFRIDLSTGSIFGTLSATTAPANFVASYPLANTNNHPLSTGPTINFAPVAANPPATATITISNQGRGTGTVSGVFLAGTAFRLSGLPLLPATLPAGQSVHF